jgi:hypothetical protein
LSKSRKKERKHWTRKPKRRYGLVVAWLGCLRWRDREKERENERCETEQTWVYERE